MFNITSVFLLLLKVKYLCYQVYSEIVAIQKESASMQSRDDLVCLCPLEGVIDVISKKWTLLIVNVIGNYGQVRFSKLVQELRGISPKTLADTLKQLQEEGLIRRESFAEIPPRVEYSLTDDGEGLREAIMPVLRWAATRKNSKKRCSTAYCKMPGHRIKSRASGQE
jgi:DNA-binding HxlR family transcriptional regulator